MSAADSTLTVVRAALGCDAGVPETVRRHVLRVLAGSKTAVGVSKGGVARRFGITVRSVDRWLASGRLKLRPVRVNPRVIRFDAEEVDREWVRLRADLDLHRRGGKGAELCSGVGAGVPKLKGAGHG